MKRISLLILSIATVFSAFGWGAKGHDVVAAIAEKNVTPEVYKKVVAALDNHSFVYYANWMDNASHTPQYAYTKTWHYANVDEGNTYQTQDKNPNGDVVKAINDIYAKLKKGGLSKEDENISLRMLIHLVGDLHAPLHAGHLSDLGGNRVSVKFFNRPKKLHSIWDSDLVESAHKWSYSEWVHQLDDFASAQQKAEYVKGKVEDWFTESCEIAKDIYFNTPTDANVSYDYIAHYAPTIETRLLKGGVRLAYILNNIYAK
ncbi:MAG: S1/P1 nuclease [Alistipes sp.]|nr:S1/P1 nuclease [Candidatus Alistipes equi]